MNTSVFPKLIQELVENDIEVVLTKKGYKVGGFYKSGEVLLTCKPDGSFDAEDRYKDKTNISSLEDLTSLNFSWWIRTGQGMSPNANWLPLLEKFKFVKVKQVTTTVIEPIYH